MSNLLSGLLETIHKYYPVGVYHLSYPGQQELKKIIETKINDLHDKKETAWMLYTKTIKEIAPSYRLINHGTRQFPSYVLWLEIEEVKPAEQLTITSNLVISFSLLGPYYTWFIVDTSTLRIPVNDKLGHRSLTNYMISLESNRHFPQITPLLEKLTLLSQEFFPKHNFVDHTTIFNTKVEAAIPYGSFDQTPSQGGYPIYNFMFDNFYETGIWYLLV